MGAWRPALQRHLVRRGFRASYRTREDCPRGRASPQCARHEVRFPRLRPRRKDNGRTRSRDHNADDRLRSDRPISLRSRGLCRRQAPGRRIRQRHSQIGDGQTNRGPCQCCRRSGARRDLSDRHRNFRRIRRRWRDRAGKPIERLDHAVTPHESRSSRRQEPSNACRQTLRRHGATDRGEPRR